MTPIEFPEQNVVLAKAQPEYAPLTAHQAIGDPQGRTVFCWQPTWRERIEILLFGEIWHQVLTFHQPLQPQMLGVEKPAMLHPAIKWNEGNKVVQDHRDGTIYEAETNYERAQRGISPFKP